MEVISGHPTTTATHYAGFWNRFLAIIIDGLIVGAVQSVFLKPMFGIPMWSYMERDESGVAVTMWEGPNLNVQLLSMLIGWLYFAMMESSNKQATVGKLALNLRVTDLNGNRISFAKATGRYFGKYLSAMIAMIGFLMAAFTKRKQALHDVLAETLVLKNA